MTGHSSDNEDAPDAASEKAGDEEKNVGESATEVKGPDTKSQSNGDVVTTQPKATQLRDWHDGLCSCHRDIGNCFLVAFCPVCAAAYEFYKHDENPLLGFCFSGTIMALVAQYRAKNGIMGSLCTDFLTTYFCGSCMLCRLHRDFKFSSRST